MKHDLVYEEFKDYEVEILNKEEFDKEFTMFGESYSHRFKFNNDYGASVIKHHGSYGYEDDLFELAVLFFDEDGVCHLSYNTPITNDVIGFLTNDEVLGLLKQIRELN